MLGRFNQALNRYTFKAFKRRLSKHSSVERRQVRRMLAGGKRRRRRR